jgi:peptidoglycan-associated lipoprotein
MTIKSFACVALLVLTASACSKNQPPVARPLPPPPPPPDTATVTPTPPPPAKEPLPPPPLPPDSVAGRSLDDINKDSPLRPVFFEYDSAEVNDAARQILQANAAVLKKYPTWVITIEGHCDERGTAEYNLALGERRAVSARAYLVSLGIDASRLRTVSYGSEFPFDPAHQESAWSRNRRAHFVITAR